MNEFFQDLMKRGLVKQLDDHSWHSVDDPETQKALREEMEADRINAQKMKQQMEQQPGFPPSEERIKPSLQLEENNYQNIGSDVQMV